MKNCYEIFVYEINPDHLDEFISIKDQLINEAHSIPGLLESATFRSNEQDNLFIDRMKWEVSMHHETEWRHSSLSLHRVASCL